MFVAQRSGQALSGSCCQPVHRQELHHERRAERYLASASNQEATHRWTAWYRKAVYSKIKPLVKFAEELIKYVSGILSHATYAIHVGVIEGMSSKIKVIKRRAYGYREDEYFFLKLRYSFT